MSGTKDCKFCDKKGLLVLPLRYSVVVADTPADLGALPALPGKLGAGVTDLALSDHAKYAVRLAREGYLYVLLERLGIKSWYAYYITEDAFLYEFPADSPPQIKPEFSCDVTNCGVNASMVAIPNAQDVKKAYFLYSPSPLSPAKLKEYKDSADAYVSQKKMQALNPADWVAGSTAQPHTLLSSEAEKTVLEYTLFNQYDKAYDSPLGKAMEVQLFPAMNAAYAGMPPDVKGQYSGRLGALLNAMKRQGAAAFAVYDHIGITQELNNFRNAALAPIEAFLNKADKNKITNERKYVVYEAVQEVKNGLEKGLVTDNKEFLDTSRNWSEQQQTKRLNNAKLLRLQGRAREADAIEADVAQTRKIRDENYAKRMQEASADAKRRWADKYASLLDEPEMTAVFTGLNKVIDDAKKNASDKRADDHLKWLTADRLYDAFDTYDPAENLTKIKSGFGFQSQAAACTFGMGGIDKCAAQLDKWIASPTIDRKNLFMRAFTLNQRDLQKEVEQAMAQAKQAAAGAPTPDMINWTLVQKTTKGLIDAFKKVDSAWDEFDRNRSQTGAAFKNKFEALAYQKISEIGRTIFRKGLGNTVDVKLVAGLGAVLYARTGMVAESLRFDELMYRIDPENAHKPRKVEVPDPKNPGQKVKGSGPNVATTTEAGTPRHIDPEAAAAKAREARERIAKTLDDALAKGNVSNYHQVRVGVIVSLLEAINFTSQSLKSDKTSEDYLKQTGAAFALISVSLDLAYTGAKLIREHAPGINSAGGASRAAIRGAGETVRGGLKLASGFFSCGAGLIGTWFDIQAFKQEKNSSWLKAIYSVRALVGLGSGVLAVIAGLSYCGTWVTRLSLKVAESSMAKGATIALAQSLVKLGERVALLRWVARFNLAGLVLTVGEVGVRLFILDNALESWCKRCVFRKTKNGFWSKEPYSTHEEELKTVYIAYQEIK